MTYQLYQGDCLTVLPTLAAGSVDLVLADPPFAITQAKWDAIIPFAPLWAQLRRVAKPHAAIVLFAAQPFTSALVLSNPREFRYQWVWEKPVGTGHLDAKRRPLRCHEDIAVFYRAQPTYHPQRWQGQPNHASTTTARHTRSIYHGAHGRGAPDRSGLKYPRSVLQFAKYAARQRRHPNEKPVELLAYLIRTYSNPGEVVLDFCAGSFSTGEAALGEGRDFIGIERESEYYEIGQRRLAGAQPPLPLAGD